MDSIRAEFASALAAAGIRVFQALEAEIHGARVGGLVPGGRISARATGRRAISSAWKRSPARAFVLAEVHLQRRAIRGVDCDGSRNLLPGRRKLHGRTDGRRLRRGAPRLSEHEIERPAVAVSLRTQAVGPVHRVGRGFGNSGWAVVDGVDAARATVGGLAGGRAEVRGGGGARQGALPAPPTVGGALAAGVLDEIGARGSGGAGSAEDAGEYEQGESEAAIDRRACRGDIAPIPFRSEGDRASVSPACRALSRVGPGLEGSGSVATAPPHSAPTTATSRAGSARTRQEQRGQSGPQDSIRICSLVAGRRHEPTVSGRSARATSPVGVEGPVADPDHGRRAPRTRPTARKRSGTPSGAASHSIANTRPRVDRALAHRWPLSFPGGVRGEGMSLAAPTAVSSMLTSAARRTACGPSGGCGDRVAAVRSTFRQLTSLPGMVNVTLSGAASTYLGEVAGDRSASLVATQARLRDRLRAVHHRGLRGRPGRRHGWMPRMPRGARTGLFGQGASLVARHTHVTRRRGSSGKRLARPGQDEDHLPRQFPRGRHRSEQCGVRRVQGTEQQ